MTRTNPLGPYTWLGNVAQEHPFLVSAWLAADFIAVLAIDVQEAVQERLKNE